MLLHDGVQDSTGAAFAQEARTRQGSDIQLPADIQPDDHLEDDQTAGARHAAATPALISELITTALQSAYRRGHSTETALLHVMNTVYAAADAKKITALVGLDISAAFDTIDHNVLASRLESQFGVVSAAFSWLRSYLRGRQQFVRLGRHSSPMTHAVRLWRTAGFSARPAADVHCLRVSCWRADRVVRRVIPPVRR